MIKKCFSFCFYGLVSILCLGRLQACPAGDVDAGAGGPEVVGTEAGFTVHATAQTDSITPLRIGDKIPEELWEMAFPVVSPHADNVQYLSLGDFRDKLIILDFWATWCAPCISSLYKLDTLQREFAGDLLVFPTSYEAQDKVSKFFADKGYSLPTAFDETHLKKYFPHGSIPHQVWIKEGEVMAVTGGESATRENIGATIQKNDHKMLNKETRAISRDKPLLIDGNGGGAEDILYYSVLTKRLKTGTASIKPVTGHGIQVYNLQLENLLFAAYKDEIDLKRRIIWDISDSLKNELFRNGRKLTGDYASDKAFLEWADNNVYAYEFKSDVLLGKKHVIQKMRDDLLRYFKAARGIEFKLENRPFKTLLLQKTNPSISIEAKQGKEKYSRKDGSYGLTNMPVSFLLNALLTVDKHAMVADETGYDRVDIVLSSRIKGDLEQANKELLKYGLALKVGYREVPVLIVRPVLNKPIND